LDVRQEVVAVLNAVLNLQGRAAAFKLESSLLGSVPELDSMAVVQVITALEERFGFAIDDDEIDGSKFATLGSLAAFVESKLKSLTPLGQCSAKPSFFPLS
jgi:acyl carrier protein